MTQERTAEGDRDTDGADRLTVLHLGPERYLEEIRTAVAEANAAIDLRGATDGDEVAATLEATDTSIDCLVLNSSHPVEETRSVLDAVGDEIAVVLFGEKDPDVVDDAIYATVDTVVQRGPEADGVGFLLEKIRAATTPGSDPNAESNAEFLETLVESARDGLYVNDANGTITYMNRSFAEMLGYEREELIGEHASAVMHEGELEGGQQIVHEVLESDSGESEIYDMRLETKDGDVVVGEVNFTVLQTDDGAFDGLAGVVRDVTERRQHERELRRQREQLERFASVVAHDLRNPLSVIIGNLELYEQRGDPEQLDAIGDAAGRMEQLLEELLELASAGAVVGEPERVDLDNLVEDCWNDPWARHATLERVDDLGTVTGDRERLAQLFENLFRNAVEHGSSIDESGSENGSVDESSEDSIDDSERDSTDVRITIGPLSDGGFFVEDDGPGIPDERMDRVFEHGFTTREDGTGFGLSIVAEIVDAHSWSIEATDAEGGGARFEVDTDESAASLSGGFTTGQSR